jgi:alginate O-acetyltransferase complex protein AlgI
VPLNSVQFVAFVLAVAAVFFATPHRLRWLVIAAASAYFYATWESWTAVLGVFALTVGGFVAALAMARFPRLRKPICAAALVVILGTLAVLKYLDFLVAEFLTLLIAVGVAAEGTVSPALGWHLPIGYSFVTFSIASYVIDAYRGRLPPAPLSGLVAYVAFFPKLLAGPIERATNFLPQWWERRRFDPQRAGYGLYLILWGLFKKVVIADRLAPFVDQAYAAPAFATPVELIVGTYFYAFQIYCDFSGYTDIAIGAFSVLGFELAPNFRHAYLSRSVSEFWNSRWHITLGTWFRDYLYIPLGGNRVARWRTSLNVLTVFVVSGLWHAGMVGTEVDWSFAAWGALNGSFVVFALVTAPLWARAARAVPRVAASRVLTFLSAVGTFHLITFTWIFFRADSMRDAFTVITSVYQNAAQLPMLASFYDYRAFDFLASLVLIAFLLAVELVSEGKPMWERLRAWPRGLRWAYYYVLLGGLVVLGEWGVATFIYMRF